MQVFEIARVGNNLKRECKDSKNMNMYNSRQSFLYFLQNSLMWVDLSVFYM
jgi:hypothetical protein